MGQNLILPFAVGAGANVLSDDAWATSDVLGQGFQSGRAASIKYNKALRQATAVASGFGQFVADYGQIDFQDSLTPQTMRENFRSAMAASQAGAYYGVDTSNAVNAVKIVLNPAPVQFGSFLAFYFLPAFTNTGVVVLTLNGNSRPLNRRDGASLSAGDVAAGRLTHAYYHAASDTFRVLGSVASEPIFNSSTAVQIAQAAGSPFNFKNINSTTRTVASASSAGQQITVLSGVAYTKRSATSNLVVVANFSSYAPIIPGQGNAASTVRLFASNGVYIDAGLNSAFNGTNGAPAGSGANSTTFVVPGIPAGPTTFGLSYSRGDNFPWTTIFNPNSADFGSTGPLPSSLFFCYEYELSA